MTQEDVFNYSKFNKENIEMIKNKFGFKNDEDVIKLLGDYYNNITYNSEMTDYKLSLLYGVMQETGYPVGRALYVLKNNTDYALIKQYNLDYVKQPFEDNFDITEYFQNKNDIPENFVEEFNKESEKLLARGVKHSTEVTDPILYHQQIKKLNEFYDYLDKSNISDDLIPKYEATEKQSLNIISSGLSAEDLVNLYKKMETREYNPISHRILLETLSPDAEIAKE